jgi:DNA (cytosine-5)-methyltransferase 1
MANAREIMTLQRDRRPFTSGKQKAVQGTVVGIDLFAGAGGLTIGFKRAGVETVAAIEIDPYRAETFARHTPKADIIVGDIRRVGLSAFRGKVDLVYGGPPCQPFSSGGLRAGKDDERDMMPWFVKAIKVIRPPAWLMENVPGLVAGNRKAYFISILTELQLMGYWISWKIINAADFGVPQKRRRLFVVGMRSRPFRFPKETHGPGRKFQHVPVRAVLPPFQIGEPNPSLVFYAKKPDLRPSPYDGHLFNGGGRPINRDEPCHTILASAGGNKTHFFDDLNIVREYHRYLMAGGKPREGVVPGARRLTALESAILQSFPPDMVFVGPRSAQYHQIGDAVPPRLAEVLGNALVEQLLAAQDDELDDEVYEPPQVALWR